MTPREAITFLYPFLQANGDPRAVTPEELDMALMMAEPYRPPCLGEDRKAIAQAHYAAHLLEARAAEAKRMPGASQSAGALVELQEGDVRQKWEGSAAAAGATTGGPTTPYAAWKALRDLCKFGAILTARSP